MAQIVMNLPTISESMVPSLDRDDTPEEEMATLFSILAWEIPWTEEPGRLQAMQSQKSQTEWLNSRNVWAEFFSLRKINTASWVRSLGWEDPLEKEMAPRSNILAWEIPWTEEPVGL